MQTINIIIAAVGCGIVCLLMCLRFFFSSTQRKLEKYVRSTFTESEIIGVTTRANFFGLQSRGSRQLKGNGAIILTDENLFAIRAIPFKEIIIPTTNITAVSLQHSFNGKTILKKLLCIHYQDGGHEEALAYGVAHPEKWKLAIEKIISNQSRRYPEAQR